MSVSQEFVERGNFSGAGPGELLFDTLHHSVREYAAYGTYDSVTILLSRCLWVDLQREQVRNILDRGNNVAYSDAEHLPHI